MTIHHLDYIDLSILRCLQENGRLSNVELANEVGLSATPCMRRVRRLEENGYIDGYRATLNRKTTGLGTRVFINVKIDGHKFSNAADAQTLFQNMDEVTSCHVISGNADYLLDVAVADMEAYEEFIFHKLLVIETVKDIQSNFVMRTVKENAPLVLEHLKKG